MRIIGISRIPGGVDMHMEITNDSFVMEKENLPHRTNIGIANCVGLKVNILLLL